MVTVQDNARCSLCEHDGDHCCIALHLGIRAAVAELEGRATRHHTKTPDAVVVIDCQSYWRRGRGKG